MKSIKLATKWGDRESPYIIVTEPLKKTIFKQLGMDPKTTEKAYIQKQDIEEILGESQLPSEFKSELIKVLGKDKISEDPWARITNSLGQSYIEMLRSRISDISNTVELVVYPQSHEDVVNVVQLANKFLIPTSTVAGATSVTLGIEPTISGMIALNLKSMDKLLQVNKDAQYITVQSGILGPQLEEQLNHQGLTLGHFPQSFEYSCLGGWVATRGAGQNSTLYGKIEDMVMGIKLVTGAGKTLTTRTAPARAVGPDINQILTGSEGSFGIITEVTLRVWKKPRKTRLAAFFFRSFEEGLHAYREILQNGYRPAVMRLSDSEETYYNILAQTLMRDPPKMPFLYRYMLKFMERRGYLIGERCMGIMSFEGDPKLVDLSLKKAKSYCKKYGGFYIGSRPAKSWHKRRYELPFIRDPLIDYGILIETFETSTTWDRIIDLYYNVRKVLKQECPILWTHGSHFYQSGANLYFTLTAPQEKDNEVEQYYRIKKRILDTFQMYGGTLSHHHGIGRAYGSWLPPEIGTEGIKLLKGIKKTLDPNGIMNPGIFDF
ncbi:MAG: FAD-binding oxidoreductase [Candidatus Heimdallarchaeota archaeon]|nr:MAG: FAD-binding oxidoreductase [Candidatus Heimdallarchaeota archaeon]